MFEKDENEVRRNKEKRKSEEKMQEAREDTSDRGRERGRGSGTTNQVDCLITSCIPHSSPILLIPPPPLLPGPSLPVHLHGNQTGCLIHELNIFSVAG